MRCDFRRVHPFHPQAHPSMTYQPGDAFEVFCPNRAAEVEIMLHRLGLHAQRNHHVKVSVSANTKKKGAAVGVSRRWRALLSSFPSTNRSLPARRCSGAFPRPSEHFPVVPAHVVSGDSKCSQEGSSKSAAFPFVRPTS